MLSSWSNYTFNFSSPFNGCTEYSRNVVTLPLEWNCGMYVSVLPYQVVQSCKKWPTVPLTLWRKLPSRARGFMKRHTRGKVRDIRSIFTDFIWVFSVVVGTPNSYDRFRRDFLGEPISKSSFSRLIESYSKVTLDVPHFPSCATFHELMCSWEFVFPRCKWTQQPFLTRLYHLEWENIYTRTAVSF